jgi:hypothetical protein
LQFPICAFDNFRERPHFWISTASATTPKHLEDPHQTPAKMLIPKADRKLIHEVSFVFPASVEGGATLAIWETTERQRRLHIEDIAPSEWKNLSIIMSTAY